jgi:hypothetical protein
LAPASIWFARRLRRGGAFSYNKKLVLLMYLSAPHLRTPRRAGFMMPVVGVFAVAG